MDIPTSTEFLGELPTRFPLPSPAGISSYGRDRAVCLRGNRVVY